jgi:hypothetical protein
MPNSPQNTPIEKALAILKFVIKSTGIVILSGFGGKIRYAPIIRIAYTTTGVNTILLV